MRHVERYHYSSFPSARGHRRSSERTARDGARRMLAQVLIAEADSFVAMWKDLKLPDGRNRVVRHGHGPRQVNLIGR
jgi:hypothetical protein